MRGMYDVIVVGGGVYGTACSYFLKTDNNNVLLLEQGKIGSRGATSYSRGIVRAYDPDLTLRDISLSSIKSFLNWEKNSLPGKSPYTSSGFLYLMDKQQAQKAKTFQSVYSCGYYPIDILSSIEIAKSFPWIKDTEGKIGIFERNGGYGEPSLTAVNFSYGFKAKGGEVYENCEAQSIRYNDNGLWEVELYGGRTLDTRVLLLTTGAYTTSLLPHLPIFTRSISLTQMRAESNQVDVSIVDEKIETYVRPGDGRSFYCGSQVYNSATHPKNLPPIHQDEVSDSVERLNALLQPGLKTTPINRIKGFDSYTEEKRPIIQFMPKVIGLYLATGFSGRGYKCCISLSQTIAKQINDFLEGKEIFNDIRWRISLEHETAIIHG